MYLDTSVLGALYIPETLSAAASSAVGAAPPAIAGLTEVEVASVVARRLRERTMFEADGARVLRTFDAHVAERRDRRLHVAAATQHAIPRARRNRIGGLASTLKRHFGH